MTAPRLPNERRAAWKILIRSMLPAPISSTSDDTLVGGEPGEVVVTVGTDEVIVSAFAVEWRGPHSPVIAPREVARFPLEGTKPSKVAAAIIRVRARRLGTYRWCGLCLTVKPPEWMHDRFTCHSCAERHLGVVS